MDDLDDLLGPTPAPPRPVWKKPGRPSRAHIAAVEAWERSYGAGSAQAQSLARVDPYDEAEARLEAELAALRAAREEGVSFEAVLARGVIPDAAAFRRPVTRTFLATASGRQPRHLVNQLAGCPIVGYQNAGAKTQTPLYDFWEAVSYIVEPKVDLMLWLKSQNAMSLPPHINKAFWDAMRSRQMVEERAGDLWRTADVLEVLSRVALTIKETALLWLESLPSKDLLTAEQYEAIRGAVNDLLTEVHQRLVDMPAQGAHQSTSAEFERMVQEGSREALAKGSQE